MARVSALLVEHVLGVIASMHRRTFILDRVIHYLKLLIKRIIIAM